MCKKISKCCCCLCNPVCQLVVGTGAIAMGFFVVCYLVSVADQVSSFVRDRIG